jgi:TusA-related sulfurtransferase
MRALTEYFLDITGDRCPMTFVKAKLLIERMASGDTAELRLRRGEPLDNVPRSVRELGHEILDVQPEDHAPEPSIYRVRLRKA